MFAGFLSPRKNEKQSNIFMKNDTKCRMAKNKTMRLVTENRSGLRCISYLTFSASGSGRETISFSAGILLSVNNWENLLEKGRVNLFYRLTIYEMIRSRRRKKDDRYHIQSRRGLPDT